MFGAEYRWLMLHPLLRGWLLTFALVSLCAASLLFSTANSALPDVPATDPSGAATPVVEQQAAWPRAALRLWFLVPQLLPLAER